MATIVIDLSDDNDDAPSFTPAAGAKRKTLASVVSPDKRTKQDSLSQKPTYFEHIRVRAADREDEFVIHKDLAIRRSLCFRFAATQHPGEVVVFSYPDYAVMNNYLHLLYTNEVYICEKGHPVDEVILEDTFDLYGLAQKLEDLESMNLIMDEIIRHLATPYKGYMTARRTYQSDKTMDP
ncbi:hypothetical protein LTR56_016221 [Elasticomyces elasticus]|nr:hypothetical protein LTR56_016221 [Elasticomyces elasticus]KAK3636062.1 hypothetical protein LTR22_018909 [Elasticomyces elasticus]KAK5751397.1 hypothetical protein LTS12_018555 [Elasticomyces elasticus]